MTSKRVRVRGRVQGVGYRWFTRDSAEAHRVSGWVRNRRDGTVEAELHGEADDVEATLAEMRLGPVHARVDHVEVTSIDAVDSGIASGFEFRPTA